MWRVNGGGGGIVSCNFRNCEKRVSRVFIHSFIIYEWCLSFNVVAFEYFIFLLSLSPSFMRFLNFWSTVSLRTYTHIIYVYIYIHESGLATLGVSVSRCQGHWKSGHARQRVVKCNARRWWYEQAKLSNIIVRAGDKRNVTEKLWNWERETRNYANVNWLIFFF